MPVFKDGDQAVWKRRTPAQSRARFIGLLMVAVLLAIAWRQVSALTTWAFVWDAGVQMRDMWMRMVPPDAGYVAALVRPLWDTINIATLGTLLGVMMALPLAFAAATPTTPFPRIGRPVALLLLVTSRSVNSIIWALMLVVLLGPGLLAGVLAIAFRSVGFVGKLVYEAIEEAEELPVTERSIFGSDIRWVLATTIASASA